MSTSVIDRRTRACLLGCLGASALLAVAGWVYQLFGHGVTSRAMTFAFPPPLIGAALLLLWRLARRPGPTTPAKRVWQNLLFAGLATISCGMAFQGIVEIAGVDGGWETWFYAAGAALGAPGALGLWLPERRRNDDIDL